MYFKVECVSTFGSREERFIEDEYIFIMVADIYNTKVMHLTDLYQ